MQGNRRCVAGLDESGKWIRPVKNPLDHADLFDEKGNLIYAPFNIIDVPLLSHTPQPPHSEDWTLDTKNQTIILKNLDSPNLRESFLDKNVENKILLGKEKEQLRDILKKLNRSLILFGPVEISSISKDDHPRINFKIPSVNYSSLRSIPCTDMKFVDFCNKLPTSDNIISHFANRKIYLSVGLSRFYEGVSGGDYWELIVGFHSIPDY
jgi:hypothetical protein